MPHINYDLLSTHDPAEFRGIKPFPWLNPHGFLTSEGFDKLCESYPSLDFFGKHEGLERKGITRPHDRYYLQYDSSIYGENTNGKGIVRPQELPDNWREFIEELESSDAYRRYICAMFGVRSYDVYYAWHVGVTGSEVCPHRDAPRKVGTHILYFNRSEDWDRKWGGPTLVLDGLAAEARSPDFDDFPIATPTRFLNNYSFLFKNNRNSWHGVKTLSCPNGKGRRLFNIVFRYPFHIHAARKLLPFLAE